jgi:ABC-type nitrate/sulfonate/bicarbonate transport system ATPase subunit
LDDPLSAVDAKVARSIFSRCIKDKLKGKTILLVTHGMQVCVLSIVVLGATVTVIRMTPQYGILGNTQLPVAVSYV